MKRKFLFCLLFEYIMRILFLCNNYYYKRKIARFRFHAMKAIGRLVTVDWWGIGWDGYDNNMTVQENLKQFENKPDLIVAYNPFEMKELRSVNIPKCLIYNEMWDFDWTKKEIFESGAELVICHFKNAMPPYQEYFKDKVKFIHIPHGIEKTIFKDYKLPKKTSISLVAGFKQTGHPLKRKLISLLIKIKAKLKRKKLKYPGYVARDYYPFRTRLVSIVEKMNSKYKIKFFKHPGSSVRKAYTDKYAIQFAKAINSSKIVLSTRSIFKYRLAKYTEIPMCGTALGADLPDQDQEDFKKFIIELNDNMTDDEIIEKLEYYLEHNDERQKLVEKGLEWSKNFTQEEYAKKFVYEADFFLREYYKN